MENYKLKAALFDLDGVVFDTEPQYTVFWGSPAGLQHVDFEISRGGSGLLSVTAGFVRLDVICCQRAEVLSLPAIDRP